MALAPTFTMLTSPISVIGFNAIFNDLDDIDQVEASLYRGEPLTISRPISDSYSDLCKRCASLVVKTNNLLTKQLAVIVVSDNPSEVIEGAECTYFSYEQLNHLNDALKRSDEIISTNDVAVLVISANLSNSVVNTQKSTIRFDAEYTDYAHLQGAGCLLLANESFVQKNSCECYATIKRIVTGDLSDIEAIIDSALDDLLPTDITSLEVSACADRALNILEQKALLTTYKCDKKLTTAISCQKSVLGENGVLSELMGLIHSVISLQQRYRPAIKDWLIPQENLLADWLDSSFYFLNQASPVFPHCSGKATTNALSIITEQNYSHLILTEPSGNRVHQNGFNKHSKQSLFIIGANDQQSLITKLQGLNVTPDLKGFAKALYLNQKQNDFIYHVVLIAESVEELNRELMLSVSGVKNAFENEKQTEWKTPKGSYFNSQPQKLAKTAFLYPGIGATYVGLGRDLFHLFPEIYPTVIELANNIGESLKDDLLNPRSVVSLGFNQLKQLDLELRNSLANIAECGVGYACVFTKIFEQVFNIQADYASGYSMGEVSMFAALGCWQEPSLMSARLANSDTFNHQLSGELRAIRKRWHLADIKDGEFEQIWETYSIKGTVEQVNAEINSDERVYITIVNTPDSLVIGGLPSDCLNVIKRLGVRAMPLNIANAIHCEPVYQEYDNMLDLYSMPMAERITTKMISSSCYLPVPQLQKSIAVSIAKCLCEQVDFPRLINQLADKGSRVFIEMGAGRSLCSWTDKILTTTQCENYISVPVNAKGTDDQLTFARAVAKLVSFGVAVNIESFFSGSLLTQVKNSNS